ncbi:hypothetical protein TELCIR_01794 [Teladorsagia circumcincta]|uniref:Uncharacterized protein n=1 Tax=Teladorsagia circumcincta TaxID=45464 RepID=A0A2G9V174_TELCI|nr:hypothetical protein TELCIR_01794 [Teladorsagia circumcincta]
MGVAYDIALDHEHLVLSKFFKFVRDLAIEDLKICRNERDIACILDVLYVNRDFLAPKEHGLAAIVARGIAGEWRMPDTIAAAYRLLAFASDEDKILPDEMEWMKSCVNAEEELPKRIALEVGAHHLKRGHGDQLVSVLTSFLQDDALHIREEVGQLSLLQAYCKSIASSLLSKHILKSNIVLNPGVCYRLIIGNDSYAESEVKEQKSNVS